MLSSSRTPARHILVLEVMEGSSVVPYMCLLSLIRNKPCNMQKVARHWLSLSSRYRYEYIHAKNYVDLDLR